jgi:hypothetical protein
MRKGLVVFRCNAKPTNAEKDQALRAKCHCQSTQNQAMRVALSGLGNDCADNEQTEAMNSESMALKSNKPKQIIPELAEARR